MRYLPFYFILLLLLTANLARAELVIPIIEGVDNPTVIAVSPFAYVGSAPLSENIAEIVSADLYRSGQFTAIAARDMLAFRGCVGTHDHATMVREL